MFETHDELAHLQRLLDASASAAGPHLRSIISEERRASAAEVCATMQGMCLVTVATATADGRPLTGPYDGYLLHGSLWFSSSPDSVRMRHLAARPAVSASYLPGVDFAVTVHGRADLVDLKDPGCDELRQAMLDHYVPIQGSSFAEWLDGLDGLGARIEADKIFAFRDPG